jgi:hypothetical protein
MRLKPGTLISRTCGKALQVFCIVVVCSLIAACGGDKETKKISEESQLATEAFALAETLRNAYLKNNRKVLEKNSTQDAYREMVGAIKDFDRAELSFTPTWVEIFDSTVHLTVSWKGVWTVSQKTFEERGSALFVLEGRPLRLTGVQRENPFRQPE